MKLIEFSDTYLDFNDLDMLSNTSTYFGTSKPNIYIKYFPHNKPIIFRIISYYKKVFIDIWISHEIKEKEIFRRKVERGYEW